MGKLLIKNRKFSSVLLLTLRAYNSWSNFKLEIFRPMCARRFNPLFEWQTYRLSSINIDWGVTFEARRKRSFLDWLKTWGLIDILPRVNILRVFFKCIMLYLIVIFFVDDFQGVDLLYMNTAIPPVVVSWSAECFFHYHKQFSKRIFGLRVSKLLNLCNLLLLENCYSTDICKRIELKIYNILFIGFLNHLLLYFLSTVSVMVSVSMMILF